MLEEAWQLPFDAVCELASPAETGAARRVSVTPELERIRFTELLHDARGAPAAKLRPGFRRHRKGCAPHDPDVSDLYESLLRDGSVRLPAGAWNTIGNALRRRAAEDGHLIKLYRYGHDHEPVAS